MEGSKDKAALLQRIAKEGDLDELQRALSQNGHAWDARICAAAAGFGHLEMWCRSNNCPWDERTCAKAAKGATWKCFSGAGPTAVLGMSERCSSAARSGNLELLRWCRSYSWPCLVARHMK